MNFKEIYKSANDEICGDRRLIDAVIKKSEKKPVFKMAYPLACAAAALAIVVGISVYPEKTDKEVRNINIVSNKTTKKTDVNVEPKTDMTKETDIKAEKNVPEKSHVVSDEFDYETKTDVTSEVESTLSVHDKEVADEISKSKDEQAPEKEKAAVITESSNNSMLVMLEINDISALSGTTASYARSGGSSTLATSDNVEFEGMTAEQYYEYIGTDVTKKIELPDGVRFEEFFGTTVRRNTDTQNVISDNAEFYASGGNKYVSLTTSKLSEETENKLSDETLKKSDVMGTPAIIEGHETTHHMYIKYADVYYNIYSEGLTLEEIEKLLISICKN